MKLQEYIDKILKERSRLYHYNAKCTAFEETKAIWINSYEEVDDIIKELEDLIKYEEG